MCELCQKKMGTEVHHKLEQHRADSQGHIGHVHKNHPANLMNVCDTCHKNIHHEGGVGTFAPPPPPK